MIIFLASELSNRTSEISHRPGGVTLTRHSLDFP
jgi:hypothetical protein